MFLPFFVFSCGAAVMVMEIVGARFFAPHIGTSVVIWTAIIGVVMAGLSAGYAVGGELGDRWRSMDRLRAIAGAAGLWIAGMALVRDAVLSSLSAAPSLAVAAVFGAVFLLLVPSVLLGMVSPYAVRLATTKVEHVGRSAGRLSALSTWGSIAGTFLAGFVLIPLFPITAILLGLSLLLLLLATVRPRPLPLLLAAVWVVAIVALGKAEAGARDVFNRARGVLEETETPYASVTVRRLPRSPWGSGVVLLQIDRGYHSAVFESDPDRLVFDYTAYYRLAEAARPDARRTLLIGGGAYSTARDVLTRNPSALLDVVEIDPVITDIARRRFGLRDDARMTITHEDARLFLNRGGPPGSPGAGEGTYQIVLGDAYRSLRTVPAHLTTLEAVRGVARLLDGSGAYLMNVIASREGRNSFFLRSEMRTLRQVFPSVLAYQVPLGKDVAAPEAFSNVLVIASKVPLTHGDLLARAGSGPLAAYLEHPMTGLNMDGLPILTDEYAPVEAMLGS